MIEAPCDWPLELAALDDPDYWDGLSDEVKSAATGMAVEYLWNWTGRRYGECPATLRPCIREVPIHSSSRFSQAVAASPSGYGLHWLPIRLDGRELGLACGRCGESTCSCTSADALRLPALVTEVTAVRIAGAALDPDAYAQVGHTLYRRDGLQWPRVQDIVAPAEDAEVWEVDVNYGVPVPTGGRAAAAILADQFSRALTRTRGCQLPERIQSIAREGVSVSVMDTFEDLQKGGTGVWLVDSWVQSVTRPNRVWSVASPDYGRERQKVTHHRVR